MSQNIPEIAVFPVPENGSLWLHQNGDRRFVVNSWYSVLFQHHQVQYAGIGGVSSCSLSDWLIWESDARRIDNA